MKKGTSYEMNGWKYISIHGSPKERGYAHGYLVASELKDIQKMMRFIVMEDTGYSWEHYIQICKEHITPTIKSAFPEIYEEMEGINEGCNAAGTSITLDEIIAWNNSIVLLGYYYLEKNNKNGFKSNVTKEGGADDRCSAFISCGDYTTDGKIVCAHNSFCPFIDGQYYNIVLDIKPDTGHRILMQTCPGWIWSGSDFFVTGKGIIGTETTIGGFNQYENNHPISCRIRKAMQYGDTLDDYVNILLDKNSGGYANSWLFGDINTNEIMRFELGLKYHDVSRTKNGYFFGCNVAFDPKIRNLECTNSGYCDIRRHQGARQVRLPDLIDKHKGKINIEVAKKIIGDHYDVYLKKENPCSRTICSHYDLDPREFMSQADRPKPFQPKGAVDGAVVDSNMAANMTIMMRWGNSCGKKFDADKFFKQHRQWDYLRPYIKNMGGGNPWTEFTVSEAQPTSTNTTTSVFTTETMPITQDSNSTTELFSSTMTPLPPELPVRTQDYISSTEVDQSIQPIESSQINTNTTGTFSSPEIYSQSESTSTPLVVPAESVLSESSISQEMIPPVSSDLILESLRESVPPSLVKYYTKSYTPKSSNRKKKSKSIKKKNKK